jgi:transcriptional regulator with XRE-family HTH domain
MGHVKHFRGNSSSSLGGMVHDSSGVRRLVRFIDLQRERQGLSGRELAKRSGLSSGTLSNILTNQHSPALESLDAIARGLGCSLESLLLQMLNSAEADTSRLLDMWKKIIPENREVALEVVEGIVRAQERASLRAESE